ncbi:MAG: PUR family DNA/RNA-binding protein [Chitinophagaceae bacterium]|nr:PUR family DNA/RNA-binding protein [Chitinophagaceae bacterium]
MAYEQSDKKPDSVYSKRIKAGKRRTYFFDVRATRGNDYFLTITESRKRFNEDGYDRHKIFLYKEDFNKFIRGLNEAVDFVKTELMPNFDFDAFNHDEADEEGGELHEAPAATAATSSSVAAANVSQEMPPPGSNGHSLEDVDKW